MAKTAFNNRSSLMIVSEKFIFCLPTLCFALVLVYFIVWMKQKKIGINNKIKWKKVYYLLVGGKSGDLFAGNRSRSFKKDICENLRF